MKKWSKNFIKFLMYFCSFIIVGFLFQTGHFIGGSIVLAIVIAAILTIEEITQERYLLPELQWIKTALIDEGELKKCRQERELYYYLKHLIYSSKKIQKNTSIAEIRKLLENDKMTINYHSSISLHFSEQLDNETYKASIIGYGVDIPTPKLVLDFEKGKIKKYEIVHRLEK